MNAPATVQPAAIHRGLSRDEYEALPGISQSRLWPFVRSAAHGQYAMLHPPAPTPAMNMGTALHLAVLEPKRFAGEVLAAPDCDRRTKLGLETWAAFECQAAGKIILRAEEMEAVRNMAAALRSHPLAGKVLGGEGLNEVAVTWTDAETGLECRGRVDRITRFAEAGINLIIDMKSARNAQPPARDDAGCPFSAHAEERGYFFQAAFYLDGLNAVAPAHRAYWMLCVENEPPHGVSVFEVQDEALARGRSQYRLALARYRHGLETDEWPAYPAAKHLLQLPRWARERSVDG